MIHRISRRILGATAVSGALVVALGVLASPAAHAVTYGIYRPPSSPTSCYNTCHSTPQVSTFQSDAVHATVNGTGFTANDQVQLFVWTSTGASFKESLTASPTGTFSAVVYVGCSSSPRTFNAQGWDSTTQVLSNTAQTALNCY
jgi:hypothetical protein